LKFLQTHPASAGLRHAHPSLPLAPMARLRKHQRVSGETAERRLLFRGRGNSADQSLKSRSDWPN